MSEVSKQSITTLAQIRAAVNPFEWDDCDPVVIALLAVIKAENVVANTIDDKIDYGTVTTDDEVEAAFDARTDAIIELLTAQAAYWRREMALRREEST